eukprot:4726157-Prymnesium_polylepis.1
MEPLQILFFTSTAGLLSKSIVAVLAVASPALRATSFILFVLFCNGVPFCYQVLARFPNGKYHSEYAPPQSSPLPVAKDAPIQNTHAARPHAERCACVCVCLCVCACVRVCADSVPVAYIGYWGASLGGFGFGLLVKSAMLPEKVLRRPWVDLWAQSHQLWHVILNGAFVLGTFLAWDVYLDWRKENECSPSTYSARMNNPVQ